MLIISNSNHFSKNDMAATANFLQGGKVGAILSRLQDPKSLAQNLISRVLGPADHVATTITATYRVSLCGISSFVAEYSPWVASRLPRPEFDRRLERLSRKVSKTRWSVICMGIFAPICFFFVMIGAMFSLIFNSFDRSSSSDTNGISSSGSSSGNGTMVIAIVGVFPVVGLLCIAMVWYAHRRRIVLIRRDLRELCDDFNARDGGWLYWRQTDKQQARERGFFMPICFVTSLFGGLGQWVIEIDVMREPLVFPPISGNGAPAAAVAAAGPVPVRPGMYAAPPEQVYGPSAPPSGKVPYPCPHQNPCPYPLQASVAAPYPMAGQMAPPGPGLYMCAAESSQKGQGPAMGAQNPYQYVAPSAPPLQPAQAVLPGMVATGAPFSAQYSEAPPPYQTPPRKG